MAVTVFGRHQNPAYGDQTSFTFLDQRQDDWPAGGNDTVGSHLGRMVCVSLAGAAEEIAIALEDY